MDETSEDAMDRLNYFLDNNLDFQVKVEPLKGVEIKFGRVARDGSWSCYITLPRRIKEKPPGWWMHDPSRHHFWTSKNGKTRDEALDKALTEGLGPALPLLLGDAIRAGGGKEVCF